MDRSRFTDEQIVRILQEAGKVPVAEVAKRRGVNEPLFYAWRNNFGVLGADDFKRVRSMDSRLLGFKVVGFILGTVISGEQPVEVFCGLGIRQFAQHFPAPQRWFLAFGLGGLDQRINQSASAWTGLRAKEEPVLTSDHKWTECVLTRVIVVRQIVILYNILIGQHLCR
jgi:Transposase